MSGGAARPSRETLIVVSFETALASRPRKPFRKRPAPKPPKPPKPPKAIKPPRRAKVTTTEVRKGEIVPAGVAVRVFWPLDDAWYGGVVRGYDAATERHAVLYHDGVEERLDFDAERVVTVTEEASSDANPATAVANAPAIRLPVRCGARGVGWLMPNPRRGRERVQFLDEETNAVTTVTAAEFAARFDDDKDASAKSTQSKRWRRGCRFDPARAGFFWKARGGERVISVGAFLQQQGAAWGEAIVGRPVKLRPEGFQYAEASIAAAERAADEAARRALTERADEAPAATSESRHRAEPGDVDVDAAVPEDARDGAGTDRGLAPMDAEPAAGGDAAEREETRTGSGSESADKDAAGAGAGADPAAEEPSPDWITVSVLAYSDASGEHRVLFPDGSREWLALVMQETGGDEA